MHGAEAEQEEGEEVEEEEEEEGEDPEEEDLPVPQYPEPMFLLFVIFTFWRRNIFKKTSFYIILYMFMCLCLCPCLQIMSPSKCI